MTEGKQESEQAVSTVNREPPRFRVLLHNDHFTTMDFVVEVLETVFHKRPHEAMTIMQHVHERGIGVCGIYSREVAEARVALVTRLAHENEFPLLCTMERED